MNPPSGPPSFNLLSEPWIPILRSDGRFQRLGILQTLTEAASIRQIAASNPMDNVALLRFLLAVLLWCSPELSENDRQALRDADGIPADWLKKLGDNKDKFKLLGDGERFYQDQAVENNARPVGDLLFEFPTETKIAHFRHVRDKEYGLCPVCCVLGIIRFCAFANAYGGDKYKSAANGPTPAYALRQGATLLETLLLNLPKDTGMTREAPWMTHEAPAKDQLDFLTVFAWRSRRLWLGDPGAEGECAYCGSTEHLFRQIAFTGNWKPPFETTGTQKKFWDADPHLILVDKTAGDEDGEEAESETAGEQGPSTPKKGKKKPAVKTTLGFPAPGAKSAAHVRFWRRALAARVAMKAEDAGESNPARSLLVAGPAANKGLYQDAASLRLNTGADAKVLDSQTKGVEKLAGVLRRSTPNPDRQHPERAAALDAVSPSLEAVLRANVQMPPPTSADPEVLTGPLRKHLATVVDQVVASTTPGSSLRRREASQRAMSALDKAIHDITAKPESVPPQGGSSHPGDAKSPKPRRRRGKQKGDNA